MTKTVTIAAILAVSAGLLFAVPMAVYAHDVGSWKDLDSATKAVKGNSLKLTVSAHGDITKDGSMFDTTTNKAVVGYAWVEANPRDDGKVYGFVAALHPLFRDSNQNPDAWHTHSVALQPSNGPNFCLDFADLGTTQAGISIKGNDLKLSTPLKQSGVIYGDLAAATSFTITTPPANGACDDGELQVRANGIARGHAVGITE
ncbi:hypothetical protein [Nitrosopumilus sp.]|uniref:hypothetical protein n=1 Tax=Nitrosopumilus sp. TaxID=2024843 RepID=UPI00247CC74B|nr:hypothetical protein [Nitrosopumilus sp.]MCV0430001.1 hypothetical protein [Nitrosopumilus sp.]